MDRIIRLLSLLTTLLIISGCAPNAQGAEGLESCDDHLENRLIDETAFPATWTQAEGSPIRNDETSFRAVNHCIVTFYHYDSPYGVAHQQIFYYSTEEDAALDYRRLEEAFFWTDAQPLVVAPTQFQNTNEAYSACGKPRDKPMCKLLAQYGQYIVEFNTHISSEFMSQEDLFMIFRVIDNEMRN